MTNAERAKEWIRKYDDDEVALTEESITALLDSVALEEAKWWRNRFPPMGLDATGHAEADKRIAALEAAASARGAHEQTER